MLKIYRKQDESGVPQNLSDPSGTPLQGLAASMA